MALLDSFQELGEDNKSISELVVHLSEMSEKSDTLIDRMALKLACAYLKDYKTLLGTLHDMQEN